jgi:hypothetical protein
MITLVVWRGNKFRRKIKKAGASPGGSLPDRMPQTQRGVNLCLVSTGHLERVKGIEPSYAAWEAAVLPLNYTRMRVS